LVLELVRGAAEGSGVYLLSTLSWEVVSTFDRPSK